MANKVTPADISASIQKGRFTPHTALTNMAMAFYQSDAYAFARTIFPIVPVSLSSDSYYIFDKEDLLRDNWQRKPAYGKVMPAVLSEHMETYSVEVDQMIMGVDHIRQTDLQRRQAPATADPRTQRVRTMAAQANIHQDKMFANKFLKTGAWGNELSGTNSTSPTSSQFIKFSDDNSEPIKFFDEQKTKMLQTTGREANRLALGVNVFNALKEHPAIIERIKYTGSSANPAQVTVKVLSELFGIPNISVQRSIMNSADLMEDADMQFIGDPNSFLLAYAPESASIEEPSAGYIFTWDMLGNGNYMPILNYLGEGGTHSEYVEGLMAISMKKTCDDLAVFCKDAV